MFVHIEAVGYIAVDDISVIRPSDRGGTVITTKTGLEYRTTLLPAAVLERITGIVPI